MTLVSKVGQRGFRLIALLGWSIFCCLRLEFKLKRTNPHLALGIRAKHTHVWAQKAARILGMQLHVQGKATVSTSLWVTNHLGYLDIVSLAAISPVLFVCKSEVAQWPILGILARLSGSLFLDRGNSRAARRMSESIEMALAQGHTVVVFPEGTSSNGKSVLPFKAALFDSASRGGFAVQPLALRYRIHGQKSSDILAWHGEADFVPHFWHLLSIPGFVSQIKFSPITFQSADRRVLSQQAFQSIQKLLRFHSNRLPIHSSTNSSNVSNLKKDLEPIS